MFPSLPPSHPVSSIISQLLHAATTSDAKSPNVQPNAAALKQTHGREQNQQPKVQESLQIISVNEISSGKRQAQPIVIDLDMENTSPPLRQGPVSKQVITEPIQVSSPTDSIIPIVDDDVPATLVNNNNNAHQQIVNGPVIQSPTNSIIPLLNEPQSTNNYLTSSKPVTTDLTDGMNVTQIMTTDGNLRQNSNRNNNKISNDINIDDDGDDDDIQIVSADIVKPSPLSKFHSAPRFRKQPVETISIDLDNDDDGGDDQMFVEFAMTSNATAQRSSNDLEVDIDAIDCNPQPFFNPVYGLPVLQQPSSAPEVVECQAVPSQKSIQVNGTLINQQQSFKDRICDNCKSNSSREKQSISRCKHTLCISCTFHATIETEEPGKHDHSGKDEPQSLTPSSSSPLTSNPETNNNNNNNNNNNTVISNSNHTNSNANISSTKINTCNDLKLFAALRPKSLRNFPACPVPRCGAPFTHGEAYMALAPQIADEMFSCDLEEFEKWVKSSSSTSNFGASSISFPPYEPNISTTPNNSTTVDSNGCTDMEPQEFLLEDDLHMAYSPLWVWDKEMVTFSGIGAWVCLACGDHEAPSKYNDQLKHNTEQKKKAGENNCVEENVKLSKTISVSTTPIKNTEAGASSEGVENYKEIANKNSPEANTTQNDEDVDLAVPDPPLHPHCSYARALGIIETIKGLSEAKEGKKKRRSNSTRKSTVTTRKRYRSAASIRRAKKRKTDKNSSDDEEHGFAKGTGYAGKTGSEWKGTSAKLQQEKQKIDQAVTYWLLRTRCFLIVSKDAPLKSWPIFMRSLLRQKGLVTYLSDILLNESIMDIQDRFPIYVAALRVVHAVCDSPSLRLLATDSPDQNNEKSDGNVSNSNGTSNSAGGKRKTIAELVASLSKQAALLSTGVSSQDLSKSTQVLIKQIRRCIRLINRHDLLSVVKQRYENAQDKDKNGDIDRKSLGKEGSKTEPVKERMENEEKNEPNHTQEEEDNNKEEPENGRRRSKRLSQKSSGKDEIEENMKTEKTKASSKPIVEEKVDEFKEDKEKYLDEMKKHQFETIPGLAQTSSYYGEAMRTEATSVATSKRQRRIAGEVASLFSSLPLSWSSTILLRADEDRYDFLRAVIFGPEDTPYDSGAFVFDIWLPLEYPTVPPRFKLLTTGSGRVRFNPNLYDNGKVCLSLLGTWSGPSWSSASTILQVLVSIQSLILVPDPYFNEPGYEKQMGSKHGKQQSERYNSRVRSDCAFYAMQSNLRHPLADIKDGILTHFKFKKRYVTTKLFQTWFPREMEELEARKNATSGSKDSSGDDHKEVTTDSNVIIVNSEIQQNSASHIPTITPTTDVTGNNSSNPSTTVASTVTTNANSSNPAAAALAASATPSMLTSMPTAFGVPLDPFLMDSDHEQMGIATNGVSSTSAPGPASGNTPLPALAFLHSTVPASQGAQMFSILEPGRNFRTFSMTSKNLKSILDDFEEKT